MKSSDTFFDAEGFSGRKQLDRFAVAGWMPFKTNADGSLNIYFQDDSPGRTRRLTGFPRRREPSI
jgi:hypothetical protein